MLKTDDPDYVRLIDDDCVPDRFRGKVTEVFQVGWRLVNHRNELSLIVMELEGWVYDKNARNYVAVEMVPEHVAKEYSRSSIHARLFRAKRWLFDLLHYFS